MFEDNHKNAPAPQQRPAYFWWILANILALCFVVISWTSCYYIFNNPQVPENHKILKKVGRLESISSFTPLNAPSGSSLSPRQIFRKYQNLPNEKLAVLNRQFRKNYLTNFDRPKHLTYIEGDYRVTHARALTEKDHFQKGILLRARAFVKPNETSDPTIYPVIIEYILPGAPTSALDSFQPGDALLLKKVPHCASIYHLAQIGITDEPTICATVVPLAYNDYRSPDGKLIRITPPEAPQLRASLPAWQQHRGSSRR